MGMVEQLVGLLSAEHRRFHEYLVAALYYIVTDNKQAQIECLRPEFKLQSLLQERKQLLQGKDEYQASVFTTVIVDSKICIVKLASTINNVEAL